MDTDSFWTLLEDSRRHGFGGDKRDAWLRHALARLPAGGIVGFQACLERMTDEAFTWNLWGAADRVFGGWCSDDGFRSFQHWMMGLGRAVFEAAVHDPDVLAYAPEVFRLAGRPRAAWSADDRPGWPALDRLGLEAYELATGPADDFGDAFYAAVRTAVRAAARDAEAPGRGAGHPAPSGRRDPAGRRWTARDEEEAARRLPRLSVMFPLDEPGPPGLRPR
ncbi:DUF4240 domain-containing protein [Streptomyces cocklensis]|jgi:hypothetical protein|uniref:DUF4240 domain-containing protein n=1 Tax=Actinacidiphila cocklensis TaxID=887465 RepID=A0A9W4E3P8_9ACTN|nr:DUF4240 domain-containing protein [Actinacidiphila cocklensis]MDD1057825.1 DUF4240 domain-containing protein [Actinacidiphila cocklensis]CAG6398555.1 conserved hypothetical protein [Actinacidiphila cocklensis]